ncbi:MAG: Glu/Leu/Phe/Val dehydrogenase [Actinobacteria bacterium]|nr:Glu/Leu/Phe/Val dehydrogenase [Actinomycetota bacterium]
MNIRFDGAVGPYERVVWAADPATRLRAIVAVHSTALGPAVGGVRFFPYDDDAAACIDVLRLAEAMTLKAAAAGLDLGGGKAVIIGDPRVLGTADLFHSFGEVVNALGGAYIAAEDVGTTMLDIEAIHSATPYVAGLTAEELGLDGDPSPSTSQGVLAAMLAAWEWDGHGPGLSGARVVVQGVGKVGAGVARRAAALGARIVVADLDGALAAAIAEELDGRVVPVERAIETSCDFLSPCALGGVIAPRTVPLLRCRWIVGSANNQLTHDGVARDLAAAGIGYVPDFIANAGGLVSVAAARHGHDRAGIESAVARIGDTVHELLANADDLGGTFLDHALRRARRNLSPRVTA